jgi:hypothetical protein
LTSRAQEELATCKSGLPTLDGSKFSDMRIINSSTGRVRKSLMLNQERMKKAKLLEYLVTTEVEDNNGMLFILTKPRDHKPRV